MIAIKSVPSQAALQRIAAIAGPLATVDRVRALQGGTHARTHLVQTANPELDVVLREFPPGDDAAEREARVSPLWMAWAVWRRDCSPATSTERGPGGRPW